MPSAADIADTNTSICVICGAKPICDIRLPMGNKINPKLLRIGTTFTWPSKWFARRQTYATLVRQDVGLRKFLQKTCKEAGVAKVEIERSPNAVTLTLHVAKPGIVIGRGGQGAEELKKKIQRTFFWGERGVIIHLNIHEVSQPTLNAELMVQSIAVDIEKRIPFRRVIKQALGRIERSGAAQGAKIQVKGRLNGAEIARDEKVAYGKIPLHTIRANIDYSRGVANTIYGVIGIKVWIYLGDVFDEVKK